MVKPKMTGFGETWVMDWRLICRYYEGKEYEMGLGEKRPGKLSQRLRVGGVIVIVIVISKIIEHFKEYLSNN